jgi:hypothetical protein
VQHHARVQRQHAVRGREQRIDVDLFDARLFGNQLTEAHQRLLEQRVIHRRAAAHAAQRLVDSGALHHAARERRREWR